LAHSIGSAPAFQHSYAWRSDLAPAAGAKSLKQAYACWKAGADPLEWAKSHNEFARAFESFPFDADKLFPNWRDAFGAKAATA
jgi:hypothetical protein